MDARFNYPGTAIAANFGRALNSAGKAVSGSSLPAATQALVKALRGAVTLDSSSRSCCGINAARRKRHDGRRAL